MADGFPPGDPAVAGFALTEAAPGRHDAALDGAVVGPLPGAAAYVTLRCVLSAAGS